jgi:3-phosphoshikimate 1-carboxyvinyltransferase
MDAMRSIGAEIYVKDNIIDIGHSELHAPESIIDVRNSGTTLRLLTGVVSTFNTESVLTGDESILKRPMGPLLEALSDKGVICSSDNGRPPITVKGPFSGGNVRIDGSMSSQFVSALMILSPLANEPVDISIEGEMVSKPYADITFTMMRHFGADINETEQGYHIENRPYSPRNYVIPSDYSSAAFPLVAGALGGEVTVCNMDPESKQGDRKIVDILEATGMDVTRKGDKITCKRTGRPTAVDVDLSDIPDLFPIVSVLLSTADGESVLYGAPHLRFKESDRIQLTTNMISSLGGKIVGTDDGCIIDGVKKLKGGRVEHNGDHRMMMSAAIASLVCEQSVSMVDDSCWNVSYPRFVEEMESIGLRCDRCTR